MRKILYLFFAISLIFSLKSEGQCVFGPPIPNPCNPPFVANIANCSGFQTLCLNNDSIGIQNTSTGVADSVAICWPFGLPAVQGFSSNIAGCIQREIPYNPDTCLCGGGGGAGYIGATVKAAFYQNCNGKDSLVGTATYDFFLYANPRPEFVTSDDTACINYNFQFTLICSCPGLLTSYHWDFGDPFTLADTSNSPNPTYSYTAAGTYTITCTATSCGISTSYVQTVVVVPDAFINPVLITYNPCIGDTPNVVINANGQFVNSYSWTITPNGTVAYPDSVFTSFDVNTIGPHHIHLVADGCPVPLIFDTLLDFVNGPVVGTLAIPAFCDTASFNPANYLTFIDSNQVTSLTYLFPGGSPSFSNNANPGIVHYGPGSYQISVITTSICGTDTLLMSFVVHEPPALQITHTALSGCDTLTVFMFDSSGINQVYSWTATGAIPALSAISSPVFFYPFGSGGINFNISITASNTGCPDTTANFLITIGELPDLSRLQFVPDSCIAFSLIFEDYYQLNPVAGDTAYLWQLYDSTNQVVLYSASTAPPNPTSFFVNSAGLYILSVTAWNDCGFIFLSDTFSFTPPVTLIMPNDTLVCAQSPVISYPCLPPGGTWYCNGSVMGCPAQFDPDTASLGSYRFVYRYGTGVCAVSDSFLVSVSGYSVNAGADDTLCNNSPSIILTGNPVNGSWSSNSGAVNAFGVFDPVVGYAFNPDSNLAIFTVINGGCTTIDTAILYFFPAVSGMFALIDTACINDSIFLVNPVVNSNSSWLIDNTLPWVSGNNLVHQFTTFGNHSVTIAVNDVSTGCSDTASQNIFIVRPPDALFSFIPSSGCEPLAVVFTNLSTPDPSFQYHWDFGNGDSSNQLTPDTVIFNAGTTGTTVTYPVVLTTFNGCGLARDTGYVTVFPLPHADFGVNFNDSCSPATVIFNNTSTGGGVYQWYVNGGYLSDSLNLPNQIFYAGANDSIYQVMLIDSNQCGIDSMVHDVTIHPNQVHAFFNTNILFGCKPLTVTFTDYSTPNNCWYLEWFFGDTVSGPFNHSSGILATHTFNDTGTYTVWHYADNICGMDSTSQTIHVFDKPHVSFTSSVINCINEPVQFINTSQFLSTSKWYFGDGDSDVVNYSPIHQYAQTGFYTVTLIGISNGNLCADTMQQIIQVVDVPHASLIVNPVNGCPPLTVNYNSNSVGATYYSWETGTGDTLNGNPQQFIYNVPGSYTVKLTAVDLNGCKDDTSFSYIIVHDLPVAAFLANQNPPCELPSVINFTDATIGGGGTFWTFDVGTNHDTSNVNNASLPVTDTTPVYVMLISSNIYLCTDTLYDTVQVYQGVFADFSIDATSGCLPHEISIQNNSQHATSYLWNFGDNSFSNAINPYHQYTYSDSFMVSLYVTHDSVCFDSAFVPVIVFPSANPIASFVPEPRTRTILNPNFTFHNYSYNALNFNWTMGDGTFSSLFEPTHFYNDTGSYLIKLVVSNIFGCLDSTTEWITVTPDFNFYIPSAFTPNENGGNNEFNVSGIYMKNIELEIFNRWGTLIFYSNGQLNKAWDGNDKWGHKAPEDVYVYRVKVTDTKGDVHEAKGTVTLIR